MWKTLIANFIAQILPILIKKILDWLAGASDEQIAKAVRGIAKTVENAQTA